MVTDIIHLQNQKLTTYKGNYDAFEKTREEQVKNQQKALEANERARSHMQVLFSTVKKLFFFVLIIYFVSSYFLIFLHCTILLRQCRLIYGDWNL